MTERNRNRDDRDLESPLGLADEPIVKSAGDHLESHADPTARRRRARALGEDGIERRADPQAEDNIDPDGAAGIDMGYGGEGTDIKGR
jgi:hypothetical protein